MDTPRNVNIVGTDSPIPVVIEEVKPPPQIVSKGENQTLAPTTTHQEDVTTAGQRRINLIWEITQATVAISITWSVIYTSINNISESGGVLTNAFFLIVSMYFVRTNHQLIGGTGAKPVNQQR